MVSAQEEEVPFSNIIYPADAKGMVGMHSDEDFFCSFF